MPLADRCSFRHPALLGLGLAFVLTADPPGADAQVFTRLSDPANPITTDPGGPGFSGASWIDADGDTRLDLFVSNVGLYRNLGGGTFVKQTINGNANGLGNSWSDYDNDGDADFLMCGGSTLRGSRLFRNDGPAGFTIVTAGGTGDSLGNAGWACAWGDYDADGFTDVVIAAPFGFTGSNPNRLLRNQGNGTLLRDLTTDVTVGLAPYTVPSWSDFDLDGDLDLSIGAGPANGTLGVDYFYRNLRLEGGAPPLLDRILGILLTNDTRDGQIVNWPDYDNDGDLDCFITNYRNNVNHLYRNDAGTYVRMTGAQVGAIASDVGWNLSSCWADFDNDGDLDCYVTRTSGFPNRYYRNEGSGTFTSVLHDPLTSAPAVTTVAADYDEDGDLDLFVSAAGPSKGLYRNTAPPGNHWFQLRLTGVLSNRSAIGAKVRLRATINGNTVTQIREVSAQNAFNGQSSLVQHFGLGDATTVEWLQIEWPRGLVETFTNLPINTIANAVEGQGLPTAALASLVASRVTADGVELEWYGSMLEADRVFVHRRTDGSESWEELGAAHVGSAHLATFVDATAGPGRWAYRLGDDRGEWLTDEAWVEVTASDQVGGSLALGLAVPMSFGGRLRLDLTLPRAGEVRADVYDATGRRLAGEELGVLEAGTRSVDLVGASTLRPGLYWVRVTHPAGTVAARAIVLAGQR